MVVLAMKQGKTCVVACRWDFWSLVCNDVGGVKGVVATLSDPFVGKG